jgi:sec-independent protein translocase protein TatB
VFNLQGSEIIIILLLALVVLGPDKLPDAVRRFSQTYSELKKMGSGFQTELKSALDEPMREMRETAKIVRDAADPSKIADEAEAERRLNEEATDSALESSAQSETTAPPFEGVSDTGSDLVSTPGQAPDNERTPDDQMIDDNKAIADEPVISDAPGEGLANDDSDEAAAS